MSKRFTDTEKWTKKWFGDLSLKEKVLWLYICDACDAAGIADFSERFFSFSVGFKVTKGMLEKSFGNKLKWLEDTKFFIPSFIEFQYGQLRDSCKPHKPIINELVKKGLLEMNDGKGMLTLSIPFQKGINTLEEKEKEKEQEQEIITKGVIGEKETPTAFDLFWSAYPKYRAGSKDKARTAFEKAVKRAGVSAEQIVSKAKEYAISEEATKNNGQFAKGAAAWLNDDRFLQTYLPARNSVSALAASREAGTKAIQDLFGE